MDVYRVVGLVDDVGSPTVELSNDEMDNSLIGCILAIFNGWRKIISVWWRHNPSSVRYPLQTLRLGLQGLIFIWLSIIILKLNVFEDFNVDLAQRFLAGEDMSVTYSHFPHCCHSIFNIYYLYVYRVWCFRGLYKERRWKDNIMLEFYCLCLT